MKDRQPWLRDRRLQAVPAGWRRVAWLTRLIAAEHGLAVDMNVAWAPPDSMGTPTLSLGGHILPMLTLPTMRQQNQQLGIKQACRCAAQAVRRCMACGSDDAPGYVRLLSGETIAVVALLCIACEELADEDGNAFWPAISRYDPQANEDVQDFAKGWDAEVRDEADDADEDETPGIWDL